MVSSLSKVHKTQLSGQVVTQLIKWLSSGEITIGEKLPPEHEIMKLMGVGRSTIREAIKILEHQGILDVRVGNGTYLVATPQIKESLLSRLQRADPEEVGFLKRNIEMQIAYLATKNRDKDNIARIKASLDECQQTHDNGDSPGFVDADFIFHKEIALAAKTDLLYDFYIGVREIVKELEYELASDKGVREKVMKWHTQLFEAVQSGDSSLAKKLWEPEDLFR